MEVHSFLRKLRMLLMYPLESGQYPYHLTGTDFLESYLRCESGLWWNERLRL
jgi:hypothetical protein